MGIVEQKLKERYWMAMQLAYNELMVYYGCLAHNNQERAAVGLQMAYIKNILAGFHGVADLSDIDVGEMGINP